MDTVQDHFFDRTLVAVGASADREEFYAKVGVFEDMEVVVFGWAGGETAVLLTVGRSGMLACSYYCKLSGSWWVFVIFAVRAARGVGRKGAGDVLMTRAWKKERSKRHIRLRTAMFA